MACQEETLLSKLAKNDEWASNYMSILYQDQGIWYPGIMIDEVHKARDLQLSPSEILLCSIPKSGTTWLKALAFSIVSRTRFDPFSQDHPILTSFPHDLIPAIEFPQPRDPEIPLLATHIPYPALPRSALDNSLSGGGCKIVYIYRNPKDVFVSYWLFVQKAGPAKEFSITLDKAFDLFCRGVFAFGPYWEHVLGYWKASLDHPEKVLFLKYEDMLKDGGPYVKILAEFMGYPFSEEEEKSGIPTRIVDMCSFESLSNFEVNKAGKFDSHVLKLQNSTFFRKGKVDDWKNYLTNEMVAKLNEIFFEKLGSCDLILS